MKNPKNAVAQNKPQLHLVPPVATIYMAAALAEGARDYGAFDWRRSGVDLSVYTSATHRHLAALHDGEVNDRKSGLPHAAHILANMAIILDAMEIGKLNIDIQKGAAADVLEKLTISAASHALSQR